MVGVFLGGMFCMFMGVGRMSMSLVCMVACLRVLALFMQFGGLFVVFRRPAMMFSGSLVVFNGGVFSSHI